MSLVLKLWVIGIVGSCAVGYGVLTLTKKGNDAPAPRPIQIRTHKEITCDFQEKLEFADGLVCIYLCPDKTKARVQHVVRCLKTVVLID